MTPCHSKSLPIASIIDQTTLGRPVDDMLNDAQGAISAEGGQHEIVLGIIPFLASFDV